MRLLASVLAVLAWLAAGAVARADTLSEVRARGEIVWGGDLQGGEPYVFEDPREPTHLEGFEVDIANALARRMGIARARFHQVEWSNLVPALERGDVDVALNGLEDTPSRRARLRLSRPYFVFREVLAVRRGSAYRTLDDLRAKRVGTLNQSYALDLLRARPLEPVLYEGQQEPYFDLEHGRVDAVLLDHIVADRYGCPLPDIECLPGDVARGVYVVGMRPADATLAAAVDDAIAQLAGDAAVTVAISLGSFAIAMPLGLLLAAVRVTAGPIGRALAATYVEVLRGTPVLLQLYLLYFGLAPVLKLGAMTAATLGLGLNYAAYEAEVYRGALLAVPRGQIEAAAALGLSTRQALRHVMLPQAMRSALPAVTNDLVSLLKDSSLVSVLTVVELTKRMTIAAVEVRSWLVPGLLCAGLYFAMSFPLSRLSRRLEAKLRHD
jgi:polar amino acid transport system substrate-binding protein